MRFFLPLVILLVACTTTPPPAPEPDWKTVEQCDSALPTLSGLDLARGTTESGIKSPKIIKRVSPVVPSFTGHVSSICRTSGDQQFVKSVVAAMRQWIFEPATLDGKPIKVRFRLTSRFHN
jgi:hypothetical protein